MRTTSFCWSRLRSVKSIQPQWLYRKRNSGPQRRPHPDPGSMIRPRWCDKDTGMGGLHFYFFFLEEPGSCRRARSTGSTQDLFEDLVLPQDLECSRKPYAGWAVRPRFSTCGNTEIVSGKCPCLRFPAVGIMQRDGFCPQNASRESLGVTRVLDL